MTPRGARGHYTLRPTMVVVTGDFRRAIVSRGHDARGEFAILDCQHKIRKKKSNAADTVRWCTTCANRSPFR